MQPKVEAARVGAGRGAGLTSAEAAQRLARFGPNLPVRANRMAAARERAPLIIRQRSLYGRREVGRRLIR